MILALSVTTAQLFSINLMGTQHFISIVAKNKIDASCCYCNRLYNYKSAIYWSERLLCTNIAERRVSPARAIARLYKQRELKFPQQFVVEFIQVMGMYPVGSVLELNTGELALVLEQNELERLCPSVAVITDADKAILDKPELIDLASQQESNGIRSVSFSANIQKLQLPLDDYRFRFIGKKLGVGPLSIRI